MRRGCGAVSELDYSVSNQAQNHKGPGCLYVVATPIGNLGDISERALAVLRSVDCVAAEDTRHTGRLLQQFAIKKPLLALHDHNEDRQAPGLVARLQGGERIALVSDAGTPLISDPGFPLVRACRNAGVVVVPVPGPSALVAALSVAGLPTDRFRFEGFVARKPAARKEQLTMLADEVATLVFYESSHRVQETLEAISEVFGAERYLVLARELTKMHETVLAASVQEVLARVVEDDDQRRGEFVLMVAGCEPVLGEQDDRELDRVLGVLLDELPVKQAAGLAARLLDRKKNAVYQRALSLKGAGGRP